MGNTGTRTHFTINEQKFIMQQTEDGDYGIYDSDCNQCTEFESTNRPGYPIIDSEKGTALIDIGDGYIEFQPQITDQDAPTTCNTLSMKRFGTAEEIRSALLDVADSDPSARSRLRAAYELYQNEASKELAIPELLDLAQTSPDWRVRLDASKILLREDQELRDAGLSALQTIARSPEAQDVALDAAKAHSFWSPSFETSIPNFVFIAQSSDFSGKTRLEAAFFLESGLSYRSYGLNETTPEAMKAIVVAAYASIAQTEKLEPKYLLKAAKKYKEFSEDDTVALETYERIWDQYKEEPDFLYVCIRAAQGMAELGKPEEGIAALNTLRSSEDLPARDRYSLARSLIITGDTTSAADEYKKIYETEEHIGTRVSALLQWAEIDVTFDVNSKLLGLLALPELSVADNLSIASGLMQTGNDAVANGVYLTLLELPDLTVNDRFSIASGLAKTNETEKAIEVYSSIVDSGPTIKYRFKAIRALLEIDPSKAFKAFDVFVTHHPRYQLIADGINQLQDPVAKEITLNAFLERYSQ